MRISEIGEFGLIDRIKKDTIVKPQDVLLGIGDDCAAYYGTSSDKVALATSDMLVENIHFILSAGSPRQLGKKAMAVNLSDVAAMGGIPRHTLISLGISPDTSVEFIEELAEGIKEEARLYEVNLIGGDTVRSPLGLIINIALIGEVESDLIVKRSTARPGELIMVTGDLGGSAAGLILLLEEKKCSLVPPPLAQEVKSVHLSPTPRLKEGRVMAREKVATSMIDISDGLASDLTQIGKASGVGAMIYAGKVPILPAAKRVGELLGVDPLSLALYGGEDYELLFTTFPEKADSVIKLIREKLGTKVSIIGEIRDKEQGLKIKNLSGEIVDLQPKGYNHFSSFSTRG